MQHNRIDGVTKSMKPAVADYQFRILCMRIVPVVGDTIYLVDHPTDITMNGHVYLSLLVMNLQGIRQLLDSHQPL